MTCYQFGNVHVCRPGPTTREVSQHQRSAAHCRGCGRRTVQTLVFLVEIEPSYYEPQRVWACACGFDNLYSYGWGG